MEPNKEILLSLPKNNDRPFGFHLDNLTPPRQRDPPERRSRQNNKNVGHNQRQPDPQPSNLTFLPHHQTDPICQRSGNKLLK